MRFAATCLVTILLAMASRGEGAEMMNVASREAGASALADSVFRHRWGLDCWQKSNLNDGRVAPDAGKKESQDCWASDDLRVPHRAGVAFARRARLERVAVHWWNRGRWSGRFAATLDLLRDGAWTKAVEFELSGADEKTELALRGALADGTRVTLAPLTAGTTTRRLHIVEFEAWGQFVEPPAVVDGAKVGADFAEECRRDRIAANEAELAEVRPLILAKPKSGGFWGVPSREGIELARQNVKRYAWAAGMQQEILRAAEWWAAKEDEELWELIPEENPRALCPSFEFGCPIHGGARHTFQAGLTQPYRWKCKYGGEWWYDGARVTNPKTGEEVVVRDDGGGWLAPEGFQKPGYRYYFVAAYRHHLIMKFVGGPYEGDLADDGAPNTAVAHLARAYALTGKPEYAHKCALVLARIGQLYGAWNGCVESTSEYQDGGIGQFERYYSQTMIQACDLIFDEVLKDEALAQFLSAKLARRLSPQDVGQHLQLRLLGNLYLYLRKMRPFMSGDYLIHENEGLGQLGRTLGSAAIIRQALEDDYGLRTMRTNWWFRDGKFLYDASGYNVGNNSGLIVGAEWFHGFRDGAAFREPLDIYRDPAYGIGALFEFLDRIECDGRLPQIGDTLGSRDKRLHLRPRYDPLYERAWLRYPEKRDDYAARLAAALDEKGERPSADWWSLCHVGEPPVSAPVPPPKRSCLLHDSGIAILRAGSSPERRIHVPISFSAGSYAHGHADKLAINIIAKGYDWSADLGYPTSWTDVKSRGWETATASHCTVVVDGRGQTGNQVGSLHFYAAWPAPSRVEGPGLSVVEASCEGAYGVPLYRRTVALVALDDERAYVVDVFRVAGGKTRDYLFHSLGDGTGDDLELKLDELAARFVRQAKGTLAGEDVALATKPNYGFLFDVQRCRTEGGFTAVWRAPQEKNLGLRLLTLGGAGRELIRAKGEGYGVRDKSPFEAHLIQRHVAAKEDEPTTFVNLFEVFDGTPALDEARLIATDEEAIALRVASGPTVDYFISRLEGHGETMVQVDGAQLGFDGRFAHVRVEHGKVRLMRSLGGRLLRFGAQELRSAGSWFGTIESADVERDELLLRCAPGSPPLPEGAALAGRTLVLSHPSWSRNSSYEIRRIQRVGEGVYRVKPDMTLLIGRGRVGEATAGGNAFTLATPCLKMAKVPALFAGKWVRLEASNRAPEFRLKSARPEAVEPEAPGAAAAFAPGGEAYFYDVGQGAAWHLPDGADWQPD